MRSITLNAYAKINLSLDVLGLREDGYHNIESLMQGIDLYDVVTVDYDESAEFSVELKQNVDGLPTGGDNLAVKGANAIAEAMKAREDDGIRPCGAVRITIDKRLPIAAGIAGGSGNAAAAMLGINLLAEKPFGLADLMAIGRKVGADVPFSIFMNACRNKLYPNARAAAYTKGIGDIIEPTEPIHKYVIMMNPGVPVSTAEVYKKIDSIPEDQRGPAGLWSNMMEKWTLANVAEAAELHKAMQENLRAETVLMSGSGPTMVAYYDDMKIADEDYKAISKWAKAEWRMWLTETGKE